MKKTVIFGKCGAPLEYDDKSVHEGLRESEEVYCPQCGNIVARVFTDLVPQVRVVKKDD